jgi:phenylacetate-coenzyme A ligase PaaK-like adenylate-forming protein
MFGYEDKKQLREIEKQITENQQLYQRVFDSEDGRKVLRDLEKRCFINHTTYNDNHGQMSFNEGRRSIYVHIKNLLEKDLKQILEDLTKGE